MGWQEVFVVSGAKFDSKEPAFVIVSPSCSLLKPKELKQKSDSLVLDFATSLQYRAGHIPGSAFAIRSRLANHLASFTGPVACTSPDGVLARFAAADLSALLKRDVAALEGGTQAWKAAGLPMEAGETRMLEPPAEDVWYKPYDRKSQVEAAMQDYLTWEVALVEQIRRDPDCRFRDFPPP
jgi:rhodanese-related sulfurtransferase